MERNDNDRFTILGKRNVISLIKMAKLSGRNPDNIRFYVVELFIVNSDIQHEKASTNIRQITIVDRYLRKHS